MKRITFEDILGYVFKFVIVSFTVIFLVSILTKFNVAVEEKTLEKVSVELMDNIMSSGLITNGIFNASELDKYDGTVIEPYVRHCKYAYRLKIKCLDICDKEWEFGYHPDEFVGDLEKYKLKLSGGVYINGLIAPAEIELAVYSNSFTRLMCMIEKAYRMKEIFETDCLWMLGDECGETGGETGIVFRDMNNKNFIYQTPHISSRDYNYIINHPGEYKRYFPADIEFEDTRARIQYPRDVAGKDIDTLKIIPIKKQYLSVMTGLCKNVPNEAIAQPNDNNIVVILCVEVKQ